MAVAWPGQDCGRADRSTRAVPGIGSAQARPPSRRSPGRGGGSSTSRRHPARGPATPGGPVVHWGGRRCRGGPRSTTPHDPRRAAPARPDPTRWRVDRDRHRGAPPTAGDHVGTGIRPIDFIIGGAPPLQPRPNPGAVDGCCPDHARDLACPRHRASEGGLRPSGQRRKSRLSSSRPGANTQTAPRRTLGPATGGLGPPQCRHPRSAGAVAAQGKGIELKRVIVDHYRRARRAEARRAGRSAPASGARRLPRHGCRPTRLAVVRGALPEQSPPGERCPLGVLAPGWVWQPTGRTTASPRCPLASRSTITGPSRAAHGRHPDAARSVIQRVGQRFVSGGSPRRRATPGPGRAAGPRHTRTTGRVRRASGPARP